MSVPTSTEYAVLKRAFNAYLKGLWSKTVDLSHSKRAVINCVLAVILFKVWVRARIYSRDLLPFFNDYAGIKSSEVALEQASILIKEIHKKDLIYDPTEKIAVEKLWVKWEERWTLEERIAIIENTLSKLGIPIQEDCLLEILHREKSFFVSMVITSTPFKRKSESYVLQKIEQFLENHFHQKGQTKICP